MPAMTRGMEDYGRYGLGANADSVSVMRLEGGTVGGGGGGRGYNIYISNCALPLH